MMTPFIKVAATELEDDEHLNKAHSENFEIMKFEGDKIMKDFNEKIEPYRKSKTLDSSKFELKEEADVDFGLNLLEEDRESDTNFHILWSYYHDSDHIFKDY